MRDRLQLTNLAAGLAAASLCAAAPQQSRPDFQVFNAFHAGRTISQRIDADQRTLLPSDIHPAALHSPILGPVDPSFRMDRMILSFKMSPDALARRDQLLAAQQDPKSPYFHQWLTAEQYGQLFGPSQEDVDAVAAWLLGQGFRIEEVSPSHLAITFSGSAAQVQQAFRTSIQSLSVDGVTRHANTLAPSIPSALADVVAGVVSLHDIPRKAMNHGFRKLSDQESDRVRDQGTGPNFTSGSTAYMAANDFKTIYDVAPLYTAGIDGTGTTIGIVGRTNIHTSDVSTFRSDMGLSVNTPTVVLNGTDPGDLGGGEETEALLDTEWSGAVARNATIKFVVSKSGSSDGVDLSAQYIVDNASTLGITVMSTSFGSCESGMGSSENTFYNNLWAQAASEGVTSFVSAGDAGAAGCNGGGDTTGSGQAVNGLASTPYNVCVGGTQFSEGGNFSTYWGSTQSDYSSAKSYIPEVAWNESGTVSGGSNLWSTGGGTSTLYTKPTWQSGTGVPADGMRDCPDVSLTAASHDGYIICQGGSLGVVGGTSAGTPAFAGLMALVVQHMGGTGQGNANYSFYQLARAQYAGGTAIFHDITSGDNSVPGTTGFSCGTGYDEATGLGSVDANALITNWITPDSTAPTASASVSGQRGVVAFSATASDNVGVTKVVFYLDGSLYGTRTSAPYKMGWNSTLGSDGSHSLYVVAFDAAENSTISSTASFSIDNTAPSGTCSVSGSRGIIALSANATDNVAVTKVTFYLDGSLYGTDTSSPFKMGWNSAAGTDGSHSLYAVAYDAAGNSATLPTLDFTIDNTPPTASCSESGASGAVTFTATASDNVGVTKVIFYLDGKLYGSKTAAPFKMGWNSALGANGSHTLQVYAYDAAGNSTASSVVSFNTSN